MWYEICSNFTKGLVIDLINEFGIRLKDSCLDRLEKTISGLSPLGFSILDYKDDIIISIVLRKGVSRLCYLKFDIFASDYENIGEVFQ